MKIEDVLYKTPEMTEEKLLELIDKHSKFLKRDLIKRLKQLNNYQDNLNSNILKEWDLIQEKKSFLTKSQRDQILALVSMCLIQMTKGNG